jgi:hypothetical protein
MIKPLKSILSYYTKGFFTASGLLLLMNLPNVNLINIFEQSFIFGVGMALLIHAFEDVFKIK